MYITKQMIDRYFENLSLEGKKQAFFVALLHRQDILWEIEQFNTKYPLMP